MSWPHFDSEFFRIANTLTSEFETLFARWIIGVAGLVYIFRSVFPGKKPPS
jgi:hypothetical protein